MNAAAALAAFDDERLHLRRWLLAAMAVALVHAGLVTAMLVLRPHMPAAGAPSPPILIELAPVAAAPETPADLAPGPEMTKSDDVPQPQPQPEAIPEPVVKVPPAPAPALVLPPRQEPVQPETEVQPKRPTKQKKPASNPAPRTTANPKLAQRARAVAAPAPGNASSARAMVDYRARLAAHLQRHKQFPAAARAAGETGTAVVNFTVNRNGRVLSRALAKSSGSRALDTEVMAMIARAQPMPPFPAGVPQSQLAFSVPIRFSVQ